MQAASDPRSRSRLQRACSRCTQEDRRCDRVPCQQKHRFLPDTHTPNPFSSSSLRAHWSSMTACPPSQSASQTIPKTPPNGRRVLPPPRQRLTPATAASRLLPPLRKFSSRKQVLGGGSQTRGCRCHLSGGTRSCRQSAAAACL